MSDPPVRHGPPAPPGIADNQPEGADPVVPDLEPTPRSDAVITYRPAPVRHDPPQALVSSGRTRASAMSEAAPPHLVAPTASSALPHDLNRLGVVALVIALALAAIWLDRGRHDPVARFGIVPQPGASELPAAQSTLAAGDPAPNFRLRTSDGEIVEIADLRGQPVLIHFWTTWCLVCIAEFSTLQEFADAHAGNLHVLGVNAGEGSGRVNEAADAHGANYPMLLDRELDVSRRYGVEDYPVTIVIDARGIIASVDIEALSPEELESRLAAVLDD